MKVQSKYSAPLSEQVVIPALAGNKPKSTIHIKSYTLLKQILSENPILASILESASDENEVLERVRSWIQTIIPQNSPAERFRSGKTDRRDSEITLKNREIAAIRLLDYIANNQLEMSDPNLGGEKVISNPIPLLWQGLKKSISLASPDFYEDMYHLFRQLNSDSDPVAADVVRLRDWMDRYPAGIDPAVVKQRERNRERILNHIINLIEREEKRDPVYRFEPGMTRNQKLTLANRWWKETRFHLRFAVRNPGDLNRMLDKSLSRETLQVLENARQAGIPFFINPYYLSLLQVDDSQHCGIDDHAIRDYILYDRQLVNEFGQISAWEKEDVVEPGHPNAAGWIIPERNVHRRYPEVAILIPDTMGRACGGLCSVCQRMYGFQKGNLNFDLERLSPGKSWKDKLSNLMTYFETDAQLRDVLITGGDALMSSNRSLKEILDAVYQMAKRKREQNRQRPDGEKFAEITRVRLGTRLPVYLPQRITPNLLQILADFKQKASDIGLKQFVIQTHFISPLEVTPEAEQAVRGLLSAGWTVTNQMVFTSAASRRGHAAKLRQVLNDIGVLPYYTFSVKGFLENSRHFATNARIAQESAEEKILGTIPPEVRSTVAASARQPDDPTSGVAALRKRLNLPFLATDRSVLNMPGVGKSLTFRVIGITSGGRRILEFDHDLTRKHSPVVDQMGRIKVIESISISCYLRRLLEMGEDIADYDGLYNFSIGETEERLRFFNSPQNMQQTTDALTNFASVPGCRSNS